MVHKQNDVVSPKVADVVDKVMPQDGPAQQLQQSPRPFSSPRQISPHHSTAMVTSTPVREDISPLTRYNFFPQDLNDSLDQSSANEDEDDDFSQGGHLRSPGDDSCSPRTSFDATFSPKSRERMEDQQSPGMTMQSRFVYPSVSVPLSVPMLPPPHTASAFSFMNYAFNGQPINTCYHDGNNTVVSYSANKNSTAALGGNDLANRSKKSACLNEDAAAVADTPDGYSKFNFHKDILCSIGSKDNKHTTNSKNLSTSADHPNPDFFSPPRSQDPNLDPSNIHLAQNYKMTPSRLIGGYPTSLPRDGLLPSHPGGLIPANPGHIPREANHGPLLPHAPNISEGRHHIYFCHLCSYSGACKDEFDTHMGVHFEYNCPHCDYTSRTEGRLKRHIKDFHTDPDSKQRSMPGRPKIFRCKQCEFSCVNKADFWSHSRSHIKEDKLLQCPKCAFVTEYKHHLEYHLRNHFGSKPFKCNKCNYSCVNKSMLNSHMKSHTNVYQYRCSDCTYATKYCHSLKLHLRKYNHKPATVLNSDGSLPHGIDADLSGLSLLAKRGPPRGPRGLRKDKEGDVINPFIPGLFPMPPPPHAPVSLPSMNSMVNNAMLAAYWPMMPSNSLHPPPPLIPVADVQGPRLPHFPPPLERLNNFPSTESARQHDSQKANSDKAGEIFHCKLCCFVTDCEQNLEAHKMKVHGSEDKDLFNMMPVTTASSDPQLDDQVQSMHHRRMSAPPPAPSSTSEAFTRCSSMFSSRSQSLHIETNYHPGGSSNENPVKWPSQELPEVSNLKESGYSNPDYARREERQPKNNIPKEGADILRQMTLRFGTTTISDSSQQLCLPASNHDLSSLQHNGQIELKDRPLSPLDLTNKTKFISSSNPESPPTISTIYLDTPADNSLNSMKIGLSDPLVISSEENSCQEDAAVASPRKRSRKGKAYKLDTLCLKLQERERQASSPTDNNSSESIHGRNILPSKRTTPTETEEEEQEALFGRSAKKNKTHGDCSLKEKVDDNESHKETILSDFEQLEKNLKFLNSNTGVEDNKGAPSCIEPPSSWLAPSELDDVQGTQISNPPASTAVTVSERITDSLTQDKERENTLNAIYQHRRKPVPSPLRRGAEVAWKMLQDPLIGLSVANGKMDFVQADSRTVDSSVQTSSLPINSFGHIPISFTKSPTKSGVNFLQPPLHLGKQTLSHLNPVFGITALAEKTGLDTSASSKLPDFECRYCDITFKDCILYTMHMGYHGYQNPFTCNMCGQTNKDKVEFFLHIARAAHS